MSKESGMTLQRPELFRTIRICKSKHALLLVPKVDRLARNVWVIMSMLEAGIPIRFAEYPSIDYHAGTTGEKSAILRAAMEAYLEGMRISDRTKAVMPGHVFIIQLPNVVLPGEEFRGRPPAFIMGRVVVAQATDFVCSLGIL